MAMNNWMANLKDDITLTQMIMPGSHDASIYTEVAQTTDILQGNSRTSRYIAGKVRKHFHIEKGGSLAPMFICQDRSIYGQCQAGSRFYDIRLTNTDGTLRGYHTAGDTRGVIAAGGLGAPAEVIFADVDDFLAANPTEFVILRISHTHATTRVVDVVKKMLGHRLYKWESGPQNLARIPIVSFRGTVICLFDVSVAKTLKIIDATEPFLINPRDGIHAFAKYGKEQKRYTDQGLVIFGEYSNKKHIEDMIDTKGKVIEGVKTGQIKRIEEYKKKQPKGGHIFQVYWTQSEVADIQKETLSWNGAHATMKSVLINQVLSFLSNENQPSIILYDFVNDETSEIICDFNKRLGAFQ